MNITYPDFIFLLISTSLITYLVVLFFYFRLKAFLIFLASFLCLASLGIVVEIGFQIFGYLNPSYMNLVLVPDPILGWKFLPNSQHTYTGKHWYERFNSSVKINSQGFRDFEREIQKEKDSVRIAILGDSLVAAREVHFEKTASQLLEKRLNEEFSKSTGKNFEVLNFGGAGYGLEQIYLTWTDFASQFKPDYVFVNVFDKIYIRAISSSWCQEGFLGIYNLKDSKCLYIRPFPNIKEKLPTNLSEEELENFILDYIYIKKTDLERLKILTENKKSYEVISMLENLPLSIYPPNDYEKFIEKQKLYMKFKMEGKRTKKLPPIFFLPKIYKKISLLFNKRKLKNENKIMFTGDNKNFPTWLTTNLVNLKIFQILGNTVKQSGGRFIIMDSFKFFNDSVVHMNFSSIWLEKLSQFYGFKYIPFYKKLNESKNNGVPVLWEYDSHFNEKGHEVFADLMFDYLQKDFEK